MIVHSRFMHLGNPFEVVVQHLLTKGLDGFDCQDEIPMVNALVYGLHIG